MDLKLITDRRCEEAIVLECIGDGVVTIDLDMRIRYINRAMRELLGYDEHELLGQPLSCHFFVQGSICSTQDCILERAIRNREKVRNYETVIQNKEGRKIPVSLNTDLLWDEAGNLIGIVETYRDLSQLNELKTKLERQANPGARGPLIGRTHALPVVRQCQLLGLSRSTAYSQPKPVSAEDLALMRQIDELHLEYPFAGARMLRDLMRGEGHPIGRKRVRTLMARMGLTALYRKPSTSRRHPAHPVDPYRLRHLTITRPNHVWAADITYLSMRRGFVYLCAVMDWASRRVLAWRLSNTLTTDFCLEAVQEALSHYGTPQIFNADQGGQFTRLEFTTLLTNHDIQISMDGTGRWRDNVFVERLWRSVKYEEVYLHAYDGVNAAQRGLERYLWFYNHRRPHRALDGRTPDEVYRADGPALRTAV